MENKKVADLITERQLDLGLTNQDIASRVGFPNANVISMIKKGKTKLAADKAVRMADALYVDRSQMMRMVLSENMSKAYPDIVKTIGEPASHNERALLEVWRDATNHKDPAITEIMIKKLHQVFLEIVDTKLANP